MALTKAKPFLPAEVWSSPDIMGGMPCVRGTRVPAMTIVAYIRGGSYRSGHLPTTIPVLPIDGIEAVRRWAVENSISARSRMNSVSGR